MVPKSKDFLKVDVTFVVGESQALLTAQEARTLSLKLIEIAEAAERSGESYPCVLVGICDSQPGRRHEEPGFYLAPAVVGSKEIAPEVGAPSNSPQWHPKHCV
jgi:hypothetical protein